MIHDQKFSNMAHALSLSGCIALKGTNFYSILAKSSSEGPKLITKRL